MFKLFFVSVSSLFFFAVPSFAQEDTGLSRIVPEHRTAVGPERKPSIAVFGGVPISNGQQRGGAMSVEYARQPEIPFGTAVELGVAVTSEDRQQTLTRTKLMFKGNYNFGGTTPVIRYSYVGLGLGAVLDNQNSRSDLLFGFGPQLGFDIPVTRGTDSQVSLGANANYLMIGGDRAAVTAISGVAKYWF